MRGKIRDKITQETLKSFLEYDPDTGIFIRKVVSSNRVKIGDVAGNLTKEGYIRICVDGVLYMAHRLAFLYMTGEWPKEQVDHRDGNRVNNRWANLREATPWQNLMNTKLRSDNAAGVKGVCWFEPHRKWKAEIKARGIKRHVGYFDTKQQAAEAVRVMREQLHGEFSNHG